MDHLPHFSLRTSSEGVSRFLGLPREIRDMIYDYIWTATGAIKLCYGDRIYTITYRTSYWEDTQKLSIPGSNAMWLMTNKQIMQEGLLQLRRHAVWHINDGAARCGSLEESKQIASILLPSSVVCLEAKRGTSIDYKYTGLKLVRSDATVYDFAFKDTQALLPTILAAHFKDAQAKTFVLKLTSAHQRYRASSSSFDFSLLQELVVISCSQLERFCVQVEVPIDTSPSFRLPPSRLTKYHLGFERDITQSLTEAVANMGRRVVKGGREMITDFEDYWAVYKEVYENGEKGHGVFWNYIIEQA